MSADRVENVTTWVAIASAFFAGIGTIFAGYQTLLSRTALLTYMDSNLHTAQIERCANFIDASAVFLAGNEREKQFKKKVGELFATIPEDSLSKPTEEMAASVERQIKQMRNAGVALEAGWDETVALNRSLVSLRPYLSDSTSVIAEKLSSQLELVLSMEDPEIIEVTMGAEFMQTMKDSALPFAREIVLACKARMLGSKQGLI